MNDFIFIHAAITYDTLNPDIMPEGSAERQWVDRQGARIEAMIDRCKCAGIRCLYFTDTIVITKRLKDIYSEEICSHDGLIDMRKPMTQKVHRVMLREIFLCRPIIMGIMACNCRCRNTVKSHGGYFDTKYTLDN